ncbi:OLC1v1002820C2 [Oldenlandia corymbosa var. corymbosa]|nr:OLC1v1002820C2 [Oldenlandia corymbosa var. corymbosa]
MWRARQKELDLDNRLRGELSDKSKYGESYRSKRDSGNRSKRHSDIDETDVSASPSCSSRKRDDEGLRDDEVEKFLQSRIKRGRGAVGSRMDETGPYLPSNPDAKGKQLTSLDVDRREGPEKRVVLGPEKPSSFWRSDASEDESSLDHRKTASPRSRKPCSRKHKSKEKSRDKEKKKKKKSKEKSRKHR